MILVLFTLCLGAWVIKQRSAKKTFRDSMLETINYCWDGFWGFVFLPWTIFKGIFFTLNGAKNKDGSIKRANFSMTRTIFALASFTMLIRLMTGGKTLEDVQAGPQVVIQKSFYVNKPTSRIAKQQAKVEAKKTAKEIKLEARKAKRAARHKKQLEASKETKTRPYIYIKKLVSEPVEFYELLLFLILAGLYYFRRDLNKGDQGNFLEKGIKMFAEAYAIKVSGVDPNKKAAEEEVIISDEHLPPPPPPHEK